MCMQIWIVRPGTDPSIKPSRFVGTISDNKISLKMSKTDMEDYGHAELSLGHEES